MSDWMRNDLLSRISAAMEGVLIMISKIATRPGLSIRGISSCEITACKTVESWMRICSCWLLGKALTTRSMVLAAPVVCSVPKTNFPLRDNGLLVLVVILDGVLDGDDVRFVALLVDDVDH